MAFFYYTDNGAASIADGDAHRAYLLTREESIPVEPAMPSMKRMASRLRRWSRHADFIATDLIDALTARKIERLQHQVAHGAVRVARRRAHV